MTLEVKVKVDYGRGLFRHLLKRIQNSTWLRPHAFNTKNRAQKILVEEDHIRTWSLHNSIRVLRVPDIGGRGGYTIKAGDANPEVRPSNIYASYVEEGTRYHPAYPYMDPASREEEPEIVKSANYIIKSFV